MTPAQMARLEQRLGEFLGWCVDGLGRKERRAALELYLRGLLLDGERKTIEPMAERLVGEASEVQGMRQRLQQAVTVADWDEGVLYERIARRVEAGLKSVDAFAIDDTGFPKKGWSSVGVQRQYSGTMGRIDNCQVATSLHLASESGGACIGMRLYLPKEWCADTERRAKVGVPDDVVFAEKWRVALALLDRALSWGLPKRPVVVDAGYGDIGEFRDGLLERELQYVVGVAGSHVVWPPGEMPRAPVAVKGRRGHPQVRWVDGDATAISIATLAKRLPRRMWRTITWREGTRGPQSGKFAAVRIRTAHRHKQGAAPGIEQWLLCEWPKREKEPTTYYLSNLPRRTSRRRIVYLAKLRWRIERDYQELKGELGLDHFEGRGWRGWHHHAALVAAAHAFLTLERVLFPPQPTSHVSGVPPRTPTGAVRDARALPALPPNRRLAAHRSPANVIE